MGEGATENAVGVAPSRECVGCGFDVVGLALHAKCPECELPVRKTCERGLLREDVGRGRCFVWSAWFLVAGVALPVLLIGFMIFADFFGSVWYWVNDLKYVMNRFTFGISFFWVVCGCLSASVLLLANAARAPWWIRVGGVLGAFLPAVWVTILESGILSDEHTSALRLAGPIPFVVAFVLLAVAIAWCLRGVGAACDRYTAMASTRRLYLLTKLWCGFGVVPAVGALLYLIAVIENKPSLLRFIVGRSLSPFSVMVLLPATLAIVVYAIVNWVRVLRAVRREMEFGCYAELK